MNRVLSAFLAYFPMVLIGIATYFLRLPYVLSLVLFMAVAAVGSYLRKASPPRPPSPPSNGGNG